MKSIISIWILFLLFACKSENKTEEIYPIYYVQIHIKEGSKLANTLGRDFGELQEINSEYVLNDSSAYLFAWKMAKNIRETNKNDPDLFSSVNEFKIYNSEMIDITKSVTFEGIENYPNPIN